MEAVLVTLDREGMALVRADGRAEVLPTRPRQVYDITGAGDMVLAVVGLCLASGADYVEAAALGNVAGGLEVEKFGVALLTREEIHRRPDRTPRVRRRQGPRPRSPDSRSACGGNGRARRSASPTAASTSCTRATCVCCARQRAIAISWQSA